MTVCVAKIIITPVLSFVWCWCHVWVFCPHPDANLSAALPMTAGCAHFLSVYVSSTLSLTAVATQRAITAVLWNDIIRKLQAWEHRAAIIVKRAWEHRSFFTPSACISAQYGNWHCSPCLLNLVEDSTEIGSSLLATAWDIKRDFDSIGLASAPMLQTGFNLLCHNIVTVRSLHVLCHVTPASATDPATFVHHLSSFFTLLLNRFPGEWHRSRRHTICYILGGILWHPALYAWHFTYDQLGPLSW